MTLDVLWEASFPDRSRPQLYSSDDLDDSGFLPITDANDFLVDSLSSLTPAQLFALTSNNADVLVTAQREWAELERLAQHLKTRDPLPNSYKDPQELLRQEIFEERKEAGLYGYNYEGNRRMIPARFTISENVTDQEKYDCREPPEPFSQAGFIPNDKQYKALMSAARSEGREKNPDGQKPYETNFAFQKRPTGTWIAKVLQPEAPPPPRTRARGAQLNGTVVSDRATRFNGEKVPLTRRFSASFDALSPGKRTGTATPVGAESPASKKRKVETIDSTNVTPRKKHPNQYTKRREAEETARLATAQRVACSTGGPVPASLEVRSSPVFNTELVRKKHPNQYTKLREQEEVERHARNATIRLHHQQTSNHADELDLEYANGVTSAHSWEKGPDAALRGQYDATSAHSASLSERRKQPNQHTKRREREEADRSAALQHTFIPSHMHTFTDSRDAAGLLAPIAHTEAQVASNYNTSTNTSRAGTPSHSYGNWQSQGQATALSSRDFSRMTKFELRRLTFKDHELLALLQHDHSFLHDDVDLAGAWKIKIQESKYPVRCWAMLKKWKEWRSEGKDKRPRDKDGNRIRDVPDSVSKVVENVHVTHVGNAATTEEAADGTTRTISAEKRPTRLRTRFNANGLDIPQAVPGSPLVNGVNARDLDTLDQTTKKSLNNSFSNNLKAIDEVDSTTKVDSWQEKNEAQEQSPTHTQTQTEYAATTMAGKGALRQKRVPTLHVHGTEDDLHSPSSIEVDNRDPDEAEEEEYEDQDQVESEDPLHGSMSSSSSSSSATTEAGEKDDTYRSGTRTRTRTLKASLAPPSSGGEDMRRTRSTRSTRSAVSPSLPTQPAAPSSGRATTDRESSSPVATRRSGLRPNPPKRTATNELFGEVTLDVNTTPTRRSARNRDGLVNGEGRGRGASAGS